MSDYIQKAAQMIDIFSDDLNLKITLLLPIKNLIEQNMNLFDQKRKPNYIMYIIHKTISQESILIFKFNLNFFIYLVKLS